MDPEDYPSDSDASDEDFRPDKDHESGSEIDSDDNIDDNDAGNENGVEAESGGKKRKLKVTKPGTKKSKVEKQQVPEEEECSKDGSGELDEEEEERRTDALWADFLSGPGSSSTSTSVASKEPAKKNKPMLNKASAIPKERTETVKTTTVTKIFEFAGEAVEVTEEVPISAVGEPSKSLMKPALTSSNTNGGPPRPLLGRSSGSGLGSVLSQIGKKNKLSTLEKTKLDWNSFKRNQGIEEEIHTHNRGKDGYLERQDFLQRADVRQFEIEKSFRQTKRSNR